MKLNTQQIITALLLSATIFACSKNGYQFKNTKHRYVNSNYHEVKKYNKQDFNSASKPKNIILMIGDGMGVSQISAGITANKGMLNLCNFKCIGLSKNQSASNYITDSAAGATAISTGHKTYNGAIGIDEFGKSLKTILEIAEDNNKSTGLISTSAITHATPAAFIAHQPNRKMYEEIAEDFLNTDIDVFIGGGRENFNERKDELDLLSEFQTKGYKIFESLSEASDIKSGKVGILTAPMHNEQFNERNNLLENATSKALEILSSNDNGFFLMIEGSQIDWGGHQNNIGYLTGEMLDFDKAIGKALEFAAQDKETLIIVTADHETGGCAIAGGIIEEGYIKADFTTTHHTGVMVPVFAIGPGAEEFMGFYENTAIFDKMFNLFQFDK